MSVEIPEIKVVSLDTEPNPAYTGFNFIKACVEFSSKPKTEALEGNQLVGKLIYQLEEDEIVELQNENSFSYKTLVETLKPICSELQSNITVIVGHNTTCYNHIAADKLEKPNNSLPTIFLIVACYSHEKIDEYNNNPQYRAKNFYFFGFLNIMHLLKGEIIACQEYHFLVPFMDCRFSGVLEDVEKIKKNAQLYNKPYNEQLALMKCCMGRYERFKQVFYDNFEKRGCVRFPTENLLKKFKFIRKEDGSLQDKLTKNSYMFILDEGVSCATQKCNDIGQTKYQTYKANIEKYNDLVKYGDKPIKDIITILETNKANKDTDEERAKKDKEILKIIKELSKQKAKSTLEFLYENEINYIFTYFKLPIYFYIFGYGYKLCIKEILDKNLVELKYVIQQYITRDSKHYINLLLFVVREYLGFGRSMYELYRLCRLLAVKVPELFKTNQVPYNPRYHYTKNNSPFDDILRQYKVCPLPILFLYIKYFPTELGNTSFYLNVDSRSCSLDDYMKLCELVCSFTSNNTIQNTNRNLLSSMEREVLDSRKDQQFIYANIDILIFYWVYIYNPMTFEEHKTTKISEKIKHWKEASEKPGITRVKRNKMGKIIELYEQCLDFFGDDDNPKQLSDHRRTKEQASDLLDEYLDTYEKYAIAMEELPSYFHIVQTKVQKRKNLPANTKQKEFKTLLEIYQRERNSKVNEGANSVQKIKNIDSAFKLHLKTYPKEGVEQPELRTFQVAKKPEKGWLIDEIKAFKIAYEIKMQEKKRKEEEEKERLKKEKAAARRATLKAERNAAKRQALINAGVDPNAPKTRKKRTYKKKTTTQAVNNPALQVVNIQPQE